MRVVSYLTLAVLFSSFLLSAPAVAQQAEAPGSYVPVRTYDASRNAENDVRDAVAEARRSGKNVLVEVGGKWCGWCRMFAKFFQDHPDVTAFREKNFVTVAVNYSPENKNQALLRRFPKIPGYPHIFVLDASGKLVHSENTSELEEGRGYNAKRVEEFLVKWAPKSRVETVTGNSAK